MVDKNINIIYKTFGAEQVAKANQKVAQSFSSIRQEGKVTIRDVFQRDDAGNWAKKATSAVEDTRARFKMYLLSLMFFGMMIQRIFQKMAETTLSTFMKITEAQTTAGQAVTALSAHWEYLKFSVGEAIGAFIEANPWIIELIDSIADFVQQNGKLVATLVILGIAFGGTLMMIGQFGLGISGISMSLKALMGAGGISGLTATLGGLAIPLLLVAATLGILWWAWETNFLNIRQITGTVVMGIQNLWDSGLKVIFRNIGAGLILLGGIFSYILGTMGYTWESVWLGMYRGAATIWNGIITGMGTLYNAFVDIVNGIIWVQNMLVEKTGFGEKWSYVQKANISAWIQDTDKMKQRLDELAVLSAGVWNLSMGGVISTTHAWDKAMEGVSPALKAAGLGMIQSGEAFNIQQEAKLKEAAYKTPQQIAGTTTINITNDVNVDKMTSDLDIDKLTKDISTRITDSLKSYGIGG